MKHTLPEIAFQRKSRLQIGDFFYPNCRE